jgi:ferrous iron transport protein A
MYILTNASVMLMIPLTMIEAGESAAIKMITGVPETRKFLENLGFVPGGSVSVIAKIDGNVIVNVKESRVAINSGMACKIMV